MRWGADCAAGPRPNGRRVLLVAVCRGAGWRCPSAFAHRRGRGPVPGGASASAAHCSCRFQSERLAQQTCLIKQAHQFCDMPDLELFHRILTIDFDHPLRYAQLLGNVAIATPLSHLRHDRSLSLR